MTTWHAMRLDNSLFNQPRPRDETTIYIYIPGDRKNLLFQLELGHVFSNWNLVPVALFSNSSFDLKTFVLFPLRVIRQFSRLNRIVNENVTNLRSGFLQRRISRNEYYFIIGKEKKKKKLTEERRKIISE